MTMKTILLLAAWLSLASSAKEKPFPPDQFVLAGTHRLQIHCEGKGYPIVVIDAGIGDSMEKLKPLQERLARVTQVCTYNRAGYGQSEAGPLPRHSGQEAEELKALLDKTALHGPYVVVGHSLGALNMQVFAAKYPQDVAGIVLLDPPPLTFLLKEEYPDLYAMAGRITAEWQAMADSSVASDDMQAKAKAVFLRMIASEHREMFGESAKLAAEISSFGDKPLVVIAAGKPNPRFGDSAEKYQHYWIEQSRALTRRSSNSRFVLAAESSHYLYLDVPDLVVESILSVVDQTRRK